VSVVGGTVCVLKSRLVWRKARSRSGFGWRGLVGPLQQGPQPCGSGDWHLCSTMGAQQTKERMVATAGLTVGRVARSKPRVPKDGRQHGSNIFTEHSGEYHTPESP
jgi:hypothetical protein